MPSDGISLTPWPVYQGPPVPSSPLPVLSGVSLASSTTPLVPGSVDVWFVPDVVPEPEDDVLVDDWEPLFELPEEEFELFGAGSVTPVFWPPVSTGGC